MKRKSQISVVILTLAVILFFGIIAGGRMMCLIAGASEITGDTSLKQAENTYISYPVTHPVASYPEEYYSGDPDRVRRMAYLIYDEERQTFLKIVVSEQNTGDFDRLLRSANMSEEVKESWDDQLDSQLTPATITGSLSQIEDADAMNTLFDTVMGADFQGTEEIRMAAVAQSSWYVLEDGYIQGLPTWHLIICLVVVGLNLLFLLIALMALIRKGPGKNFLPEDSGSSTALFLKSQLSWLEPWCKKGSARRIRTAFLVVIGVPVALTVLGFYVGGTPLEIMTCHLALGLGLGEFYSVPLLLGVGLAFEPYKILKNYAGAFEKLYPIQSERETIFQNLLEADDSWYVREQGKEDCTCAVLGERYWTVLGGTGSVTLIDSSRIGKMYSETVSGQIRTGKVRYNYISYVIYIHYQGDEEKKHASIQFAFHSEGASGHFLTLARKRLGDRSQAVMQ